MIYLIRVHTVDENNYSLVIGQIVNGQGVWAVVHVNTQDPQAWFDDPANLPTMQAAIANGTVDERIKNRIRYLQFNDNADAMDSGLQTIIDFTNPTNAQVIAAVKQLAQYQQRQLRAIVYVARRLNALANEPD